MPQFCDSPTKSLKFDCCRSEDFLEQFFTGSVLCLTSKHSSKTGGKGSL